MPTKLLPVDLTDEDRLSMEKDQNVAISAMREAKDEKREAMRGLNDRIKKHETTIYEINDALESGKIQREIEVREEKNFVTGIVEIVRCDTNEVVETRRIDDDERQLVLTDEARQARSAEIRDTTEEQQIAGSPEEAEEIRNTRLRQERRQRTEETVSETLANHLPVVLEAPEGGFTARIGVLSGFPWSEIVEATRATEDEAKEALGEKLVDLVMAAEDAAVDARTERIMARFGQLVAQITFEKHEGDGNGAPVPFVVARLITDTWTTEAEGDTHDAAAAGLRKKVLEILGKEEDEIERLAAEQAKDEAKDGPRNLLKRPVGKGKAARKIKVVDGEDKPIVPAGDDENPNGVDTTPPPGLRF